MEIGPLEKFSNQIKPKKLRVSEFIVERVWNQAKLEKALPMSVVSHVLNIE